MKKEFTPKTKDEIVDQNEWREIKADRDSVTRAERVYSRKIFWPMVLPVHSHASDESSEDSNGIPMYCHRKWNTPSMRLNWRTLKQCTHIVIVVQVKVLKNKGGGTSLALVCLGTARSTIFLSSRNYGETRGFKCPVDPMHVSRLLLVW